MPNRTESLYETGKDRPTGFHTYVADGAQLGFAGG